MLSPQAEKAITDIKVTTMKQRGKKQSIFIIILLHMHLLILEMNVLIPIKAKVHQTFINAKIGINIKHVIY